MELLTKNKDELFNQILDKIEQYSDRLILASVTFELVGAPALEVKLSHN